MRPRTDFAQILKELTEETGVTLRTLALDFECSEKALRGYAFNQRQEHEEKRGGVFNRLRAQPPYDLGKAIVERYRMRFNKPEPRLY